jgi:hypothetical protein
MFPQARQVLLATLHVVYVQLVIEQEAQWHKPLRHNPVHRHFPQPS